MPRYLVHGIVKIDVQSEIEADSKAEAMLIASKMSGSDFDEEGLTDGEEIFISTAQLLGDNGKVIYTDDEEASDESGEGGLLALTTGNPLPNCNPYLV
jgi:hypothetical protein